jgi:D-sedoheptulose 7-phosphate isomerase
MLGFQNYCNQIVACFDVLRKQEDMCTRVADLMVECLQKGNKVIFCGNGGSAADSQHLAAELMGRFLFDRAPLAALSLTVDTSALTAIGNDYGYNNIFSRQLRGIGRAGDVLVGMSTSGNSTNVLEAMQTAKEMGIKTVGLTGALGGKIALAADVCIRVPSSETNHIQEMHIVVGHWLCGVVEQRMNMPAVEQISANLKIA